MFFFVSFCFVFLLLGVERVVELVIYDTIVGAYSLGSVIIKVPGGDTQKIWY